MRILLTNDDGIRAPGIAAMYEALVDARREHSGPLLDTRDATTRSPRCVVYPIAPLTVQSATSHGITFHTPLMVSEEAMTARIPDTHSEAHGVISRRIDGSPTGLGVDGRPADCVKLAISQLWPEKFGHAALPDLVISGMNAGANCGINTIYSGTVAAALEAAFLGVPAIAVSLHLGRGKPRFDVAARHARTAIEQLIAAGLPKPHQCLSINIPITEDDAPTPPIAVAPMNTHGLVDRYEKRVSPLGDTYYWAAGHGLDFKGTEPNSDVDLLLRKHITVTPLIYDLTDNAALAHWADRLKNTPAHAASK